MADKVALIKVQMDPTSFDDSNEIQKTIAIFQKRLDAHLKANPLKADIKVQTVDGFEATINRVKEQLNSISREVSIKLQVDELMSSVETAKNAISDISKISEIPIRIDNAQLTASVEKLAADFNEQFMKIGGRGALKGFTSALNNIKTVTEKVENKTQTLARNTQIVARVVQTLDVQAKEASSSLRSMSGGVDKLDSSLSRISKEEEFETMAAGAENLEKAIRATVKAIKKFNDDKENKDRFKLAFYLDVENTAKNIAQQLNLLGHELSTSHADKVVKLVGTLDETKTAQNIAAVIPTTLAATLKGALKNIDVGDGVINLLEQQNKALAGKDTSDKATSTAAVGSEVDKINRKVGNTKTKIDELKTHWETTFSALVTTSSQEQIQALNDKLAATKTLITEIGKLKAQINAIEQSAANQATQQQLDLSGLEKATIELNARLDTVQIREAINKSIEALNTNQNSLAAIKLKFDSSNLKVEVEKAAKSLELVVSDVMKSGDLAGSKDSEGGKKTPKKKTGDQELNSGEISRQIGTIGSALKSAKAVLDSFDSDAIKNLQIPEEYLITYETFKNKVEQLSASYTDLKLAFALDDMKAAEQVIGSFDVKNEIDSLKGLTTVAREAKDAIKGIADQTKNSHTVDERRAKVEQYLKTVDMLLSKEKELRESKALEAKIATKKDKDKYGDKDKFGEYAIKEGKEYSDVKKDLLDIFSTLKDIHAQEDVEIISSNTKSNIKSAANALEKLQAALAENNKSPMFNINEKGLDKFETRIETTIANLEKMRTHLSDENFTDLNGEELNAEIAKLQEAQALIQRIRAQMNGDASDENKVAVAQALDINKTLTDAVTHAEEYATRIKTARTELVNQRKELNKVQQEQSRLNDYMAKYEGRLKRFPSLWGEFESLQTKVQNQLNTKQPVDSTWLKNELDQLVIKSRAAGIEVENIFTKVWERIGFNFRSMVASMGLMYVQSAFRDIYNNVKELDAAMTELKKVTDETDRTYEQFLDNASARAQKLGASLVDVVSSTSDFARLGSKRSPLIVI